MVGRRLIHQDKNRFTVWFNPKREREIFLSVRNPQSYPSFYDVPRKLSKALQAFCAVGHHSSLSYNEIGKLLYTHVQPETRTPDKQLATFLDGNLGPIDDYVLQRVCETHIKNPDYFFHRKSGIFFGYWAAICESQGAKPARLPCHRVRMTWRRSQGALIPDVPEFHGDTTCIVNYCVPIN